MAGSAEMQTYAARIATFQTAHQLSKRRASSQSSKKKSANTVEWPHEAPAIEELARAGFFYRPAQDSLDNVQCFLCAVKLDGWEPADNPLNEHISHAPSCAWALSLSVHRPEGREDEETRDPMSDDMVAARRGTFELGEGWCHEGKRGWRCKVSKMVEAGWVFDPSPETEDGVTCFYCNLSLDGWEPKDDPLEEHKRRSPDCAFFALCERLHGGKTKGKGKAKGRASTASKASRLSTQSVVSVVPSEALSLDLGEGSMAVDDSIVSTATTASQATVKGGKKRGRPAKAAKGRKRATTVEQEPEPEIQYPELSQSRASQAPGAFPESSLLEAELAEEAEPVPDPPKRATRKGARSSKQADSSIMDASQTEIVPKKTRGRKAKAQPEPEPEAEPEAEPEVEQRLSEVSAQLQEELEHSMDYGEAPDNESTPQQPLAKPKRGTKRTSDGMKKEQDSSVILGMEFPVPPPAKAKKGRKASKQIASAPVAAVVEEEMVVDYEEPEPEPEPEKPAKKAAKAKKAPAAKKAKGRKASSTRNSKATVTASEPEPEIEEAEDDFARDEAEIEAELARIAAEQTHQQQALVLASEQDKAEEYEPTPSGRTEKHAQQIHQLEEELQAEVDSLPRRSQGGLGNLVASVNGEPLPHPKQPQQVVVQEVQENLTPSPSGSDKENQPSSAFHPATALKAPAPILSPVKTTRIPLAPGTPNRSPRRHVAIASPTKPLGRLATTQPWVPVDLETVLLLSPQPTPGTLAGRLGEVAGGLTSPEKGMSVEEWVRWRAEQGEEELRRRCEEMVGVFEREGVRALGVLGGIATV